MATCYVQNMPNQKNNLLLGTSGGGTKYTVEVGQPVYIGTDGDSNTNRVIPTSDISEHAADGVALTTTANTAYTNGVCGVALFPCRILTTNVDGTNPPEATADAVVYILDAGTFSDTDTNTAGHNNGQCVGVEVIGGTTFYDLNLTGVHPT